jgi:hypothetical protein
MLTERKETGSHKGSRPNIKITNQIDFDEKLIFFDKYATKIPQLGMFDGIVFLENRNSQQSMILILRIINLAKTSGITKL